MDSSSTISENGFGNIVNELHGVFPFILKLDG